ncbi:MAG: UDP-glucose 4-epimerase GalE [Pseudomonadota bacterium]|nr:UDP-glucose 4-epimerase GalE [Pseudomonadota bacterium]
MILVTGGTGYIGSHTVIELLAAGRQVVILDDLSNSKRSALDRVATISGRLPAFERADLRDRAAVRSVFERHAISAVIHFAGKKAVGESVLRPGWYYDHNVGGTAILIEAMLAAQVRTLVFSSSATVYGDPASVPIREDFPLSATNAYGRSKLMIEQILGDVARSDASWRIANLRYFNPVGAHPSGLVGEDPAGIPNNLVPFVAQVAVGRRPLLSVYGNDWPTPDGTGVRDYIHVVDLARGHLAALDHLQSHQGVLTVNLGTGRGTSVLEMIRAFEHASGRRVPYQIVDRRPGDIAACYADPGMAQRVLGWRAELDLERMCADAWRWQQQNPDGLPGD